MRGHTTVSFCSDSQTLALTCPDPGFGTASTCSYSSPAYGDPCISHLDCRGTRPAALAPLMCNTVLKQCVINASVAVCQVDADCADRFYCRSGSCTAMTPLGGVCTVIGTSPGRCYGGGICFNGAYVDPFSSATVNGTCVAPNTLSTGTIAYYPYADYYWWAAGFGGSALCASGLSVPVANASGFPTGQFKCVASVDISLQGATCSSCNWLYPNIANARECKVLVPFRFVETRQRFCAHWPIAHRAANGALAVFASNPALICAPTIVAGAPVCTLLPSSLYTAQYSSGLVPITSCINSASGPLAGAVKCAPTGTTCTSFVCAGLYEQLYATVYGPGG